MNDQHPLATQYERHQTLASGKIHETPWDARTLGIPTYEIDDLSQETLDIAAKLPGHFTIKVNPLADKRILFEYGFYYCDTLLEPFCPRNRLLRFERDGIGLSKEHSLSDLLKICHGAFEHGRFHRDFNISKELADLRYDRWLEQLYEMGDVIGFVVENELVGFVATSKSKLVLHAIAPEWRGKGLAKYLWSAVCVELFKRGHDELQSSVSAANLPVMNLYASLGFRFRNPVDIYHKLSRVPSPQDKKAGSLEHGF